VVMSPAMSGNKRRPELVAEAPVATWRNNGRNTIAANIAPPRRNDSATPALKTRPRNSRSGRIGSGVRPSHHRNIAVSTTEAAKRPMMTGELQGYSLPPQTRPSSRVETPATSSAAPTKSISWFWRANGRRSTELVMTRATIPIGTLT
jgi:hypothetical protein